MNGKKITFVDGCDWWGLFIDNKLVLENHQLDVHEVLDAIGVKHKTITADEEWLGQRGRLPEKLSEVKRAKHE